MIVRVIKKQALNRILNILTNLSDKNLVRAIDIAQKFLIKDKGIKSVAEKLKTAFKEKHPAIVLARNAFSRLSPNCKRKTIENFFVNACIVGNQKRKENERKLGFGLPWLFVISPTARCNLNCIGCYAHEYKKHEGLPFVEVDRILKEAKELGIYFITISGGEPFLWPHIFEVLKKHNDMAFQIYTNGTLITKELAEKLAEVGNAAPAISIEGFEKETDERRGKGTFQKIMRAMDNLKEAGVLFGFSVTPTIKNSEVLMSDKFIDLMIKKGASFGWYFQYMPIGKKPDVSLMATPEQRNKLRLRTTEIRNTRPIFIGDFWNDGPLVGGCMAGARPGGYFHINCNGDVEPCVFVQFSVDNIKGKKLVDVIQSPFFKAFQKAQPYCKNKNLLTPCVLIDNPEVLRKIIKKYGAKPSYNGSYDVIKDEKVTQFLDKYSVKMKKLTDSVWEKELSKEYKHWKEKYSI
jgi:MoaA/NifB/PqqE/SkfB family radical SAM enzyme